MLLGPIGVRKTSIIGVQDTYGLASATSSSLSTTVNLGTTDRTEIWAVFLGIKASSISVSSATIGGNAMTEVFEALGVSSGFNCVAFYKYEDNGALGTTDTLAATYTSANDHHGAIVFTVKGRSTLLDSYGSESSGSGSPASGTISTASNGWSFYTANEQNSSVGTGVPNFANDANFDYGTTDYAYYAYNSPEDGSSTTVAEPDGTSGTGIKLISAISVEPA